MAVIDIYSKRNSNPPSGNLMYHLPNPLRVQIAGVLDEALTPTRPARMYSKHVARDRRYRQLHNVLAHELGRQRLTRRAGYAQDARAEVMDFVESVQPAEVLSLLDALFHLLRNGWVNPPAPAVAAADELNYRFEEHGVGYRIEGFKAIKIGSTLLHEEVVKPTLAVLRAPHYAGAESEFQKAFTHHRRGEHEDTITECNKALESTLKVICGRHRWRFDEEKDTASRLLGIVFEKGLIPSYQQDQFTGLRSVLTGISTTRNRSGAHGAGAKPRTVPEHLAAYMIHQTAAAILYLAESEKRLGR